MTYEVGNSKFYVENPMTNDSEKPNSYKENIKKEFEERLEQESLILKEEAEKRKKLEQELLTLKEEEKEKKKKLEQELLTLKKRELNRKYVSLATMVPFALLMATELERICSDQVLLGLISSALGHAILPFTTLYLICTLYLIYNNRKIAEKERELENIESGEVIEKRNIPCTVDDYFNYADAALVTLIIVASIVSEALEQGVIEDVAFSISSIFYFVASATFCYREYKKNKNSEVEKEQGFDEKSEKKTSNMSTAKLMLAGSSLLLIRRIMLVALASFSHPAVGPALGLVGIALLMVGSGLIIYSYNKKLENVKVSGKGVSIGAGVGNVGDGGSNTEGPAIV